MVDILPQYKEVTTKLDAVLKNLPPVIIGIDGKNGAGKSTLGRYLAWNYNITLLETDLFRLSANGKLEYKVKCLNSIIKYRLNRDRPIVVEGVALQSLFQKLNFKPNFIIYIVNEAYDRDDWLTSILEEYERVCRPQENSNLVIKLDVT